MHIIDSTSYKNSISNIIITLYRKSIVVKRNNSLLIIEQLKLNKGAFVLYIAIVLEIDQ